MTMGMSGAPDSMVVMVDGNRPASLCPVLPRPVDLSFISAFNLSAHMEGYSGGCVEVQGDYG